MNERAHAAPVRGPGRLRFQGDQLLHLSSRGLTAWQGGVSRLVLESPAPRGFGVLADGSLVVVGALESGVTKVSRLSDGAVEAWPALIGVSDAVHVFPVPGQARQLWIATDTATSALARFDLTLLAGKLALASFEQLGEGAFATLAQLADGDLVWHASGQLWRRGARPASWPEPRAALLLVAEQARVWLSFSGGAIEALSLAGAAPVLERRIDAVDEQLVALAVDDAGALLCGLWAGLREELEWTLTVHGSDGSLRARWPVAAPPMGDWGRLAVAVSAASDLAALATGDVLHVFRASTGVPVAP